MRWLIVLLLLLLAGCESGEQQEATYSVTDLLGGTDTAGYARALQPRDFRFPADHGPHPEYRNEWWYFTGQLQTRDGREFGFQVTFFRNAITPVVVESSSAWRTNQVWMAHVALSDLATGEHYAEERFSRQGAGLAGATTTPLRVWLENWKLSAGELPSTWTLDLPAESYGLALKLSPLSPVIRQGDAGLSQKSAEPGNASYYYSIPRLAVKGELTLHGERVAVSGSAWLDREWGTSALGPDQTGWDWFSLQLADGRNLMYYQLRNTDGSTDPYSRGSVSDANGLLGGLSPAQVDLVPVRYWDAGDRRYPVEWRMTVKGEQYPWRIRALLDDQEMKLSVHYWEGAVEVVNEETQQSLGRGYLEMVGYR